MDEVEQIAKMFGVYCNIPNTDIEALKKLAEQLDDETGNFYPSDDDGDNVVILLVDRNGNPYVPKEIQQ